MCAEEKGKDAWGLESVYKATDENGKWIVGFRFDANGSRLFGELTKANVGSALAIVIGGEVMATPIIRVPSVESPVITGRFSDEEARDLVKALKAGMPPANQPARQSGPNAGDQIARQMERLRSSDSDERGQACRILASPSTSVILMSIAQKKLEIPLPVRLERTL
jgi:hypothetical protein